jgi:dephospho-CoA kinase
MLVVGLTGGIGAGKSTFARLLAARGAEIIDADELGRAALGTGKPAWHSVVDQFGDEVLVAGGMEIDRKVLARIVFEDRDKLAALNAIVHPVIMAGIADTLEALQGTGETVVIDAALIVELGLDQGMDALIVVIADRDKRLERLMSARSLSRSEIEARIRAQTSEQALIDKADFVVRNDGPADALEKEADRVWLELEAIKSR